PTAVHYDAYRPPECFAMLVDEAGEYVRGQARRPTRAKRHEDDFITDKLATVPRDMLRDAGTRTIALRELRGSVERQAHAGGMCAKRVVGRDRLGDQVRALRPHALVDILTEVAVRPAVEAAVAHCGHVVGREIVAQLVALV